MKNNEVLVVGELNADLILSRLDQLPVLEKEILAQEMVLTLGSSSAIFASNLSVMGSRVAFLGKIGMDSFGELVLAALRKKNVDCSAIIQSPSSSTGVTVALNIGHERAMVTYAGAMEELSADDISDKILLSVNHLHVSSVFLQPALKKGLTDLFARAKKYGLTTSLDPQWDPAEQWDVSLGELLPNVDVFLPNADELKGFTKQPLIEDGIALLKGFGNVIVVKDGMNGAWHFKKDKSFYQPAFLNKQQVDAIGAGDSFDAGFIHQYIHGADEKRCMHFAALMGAVNTTAPGGTGAFESMNSLKERAKSFFGEDMNDHLNAV